MASNIKKNINRNVAKNIWTVGMDPRVPKTFWHLRYTGKPHGGVSLISSKASVASPRPENKGPLRLLFNMLSERKETPKLRTFDSLGLNSTLLKVIMGTAPRKSSSKRVFNAPTTKIYGSNHSLRSSNVNLQRRRSDRWRSQHLLRLELENNLTSKNHLYAGKNPATEIDLVDAYYKNSRKRYGHRLTNVIEITELVPKIEPKRASRLTIKYKIQPKTKISAASVIPNLLVTDRGKAPDITQQVLTRSGTMDSLALINKAQIRGSATKVSSNKLVTIDKDLISLAPGLLANKRAINKIKKHFTKGGVVCDIRKVHSDKSSNNPALPESSRSTVVNKVEIKETATEMPDKPVGVGKDFVSITPGLVANKRAIQKIKKRISSGGFVVDLSKMESEKSSNNQALSHSDSANVNKKTPKTGCASDMPSGLLTCTNNQLFKVISGLLTKKMGSKKIEKIISSGGSVVFDMINTQPRRSNSSTGSDSPASGTKSKTKTKVRKSASNVSSSVLSNSTGLLNKIKKRVTRGTHVAFVVRSKMKNSMTNLCPGLFANDIALKKIRNSGSARSFAKLSPRANATSKALKNTNDSGTIKKQGVSSNRHKLPTNTTTTLVKKDKHSSASDNGESNANDGMTDSTIHPSLLINPNKIVYSDIKKDIQPDDSVIAADKTQANSINSLAATYNDTKAQILGIHIGSTYKKTVSIQSNRLIAPGHSFSVIIKPQARKNKETVAMATKEKDGIFVNDAAATAKNNCTSAHGHTGSVASYSSGIQKMCASGGSIADDFKGSDINTNLDLLNASTKEASKKEQLPLYGRLLVEIVKPKPVGCATSGLDDE